MSEILQVIQPGGDGQAPTLELRCDGCGRVYVTTQHRWDAERQTRCAECRSHAPRPHAATTDSVVDLLGYRRSEGVVEAGEDS